MDHAPGDADARSALPRALALLLVLIVALGVGSVTDALFAGFGALIGGLADLGGPRRVAIRFVFLASLAAAAGAFLGGVTSSGDGPAIVAVAVWGFGCATLARFGRAGSVLGLLAILAFIVGVLGGTGFRTALTDAGLLIVGGAVQAALLLAPLTLPRHPPEGEPPSLRSTPRRHAARIGLALAISVGVYRLLPAGNHGLWVPITALLILRPGFDTPIASGLVRYVGIAIATVVATLVAAVISPGHAILVILVGLSAVATFAVFQTGYAIFTAALSVTLIFLFSLLALPATSVVADNLIDVTIGAAIALGAFALLPMTRRA